MLLAARAWRGLLRGVYRPLFGACGRNFRFDPRGTYSFETITAGDDVFIGAGAVLLARPPGIRLGNKVMLGPGVVLVGGDHHTSRIGQFMRDVFEKSPKDDPGICIEEDVWIGARAIVLKGVTVGRGAIVGAGAVVARSVPPYSIVAGVPAHVIRYRWDIETILLHEQSLYPPARRMTRQQLAAARVETAPRVRLAESDGPALPVTPGGPSA